jgi:hypothetical protein
VYSPDWENLGSHKIPSSVGSGDKGEIWKARDSAAKFAKEHMNPQHQFGVASLCMSTLRIIQNFTSDREKLALAAAPASSLVCQHPSDE